MIEGLMRGLESLNFRKRISPSHCLYFHRIVSFNCFCVCYVRTGSLAAHPRMPRQHVLLPRLFVLAVAPLRRRDQDLLHGAVLPVARQAKQPRQPLGIGMGCARTLR